MKNSIFTLTLISIVLILGACSKTPKVADNKHVESLKQLVINPITKKKDWQISVKTGDNIKTLVKRVTGKSISNLDERKIYTHLDSLNNSYPLTIYGIKFRSFDRSLSYDIINRNTACIKSKDLEVIYKGDSVKLRVCKTRYSHWIIK